MFGFILEGWLLGLATGPYCLGACAPFMVPYLLAEGSTTLRRNALLIAQFLFGRLVAYILFGILVGWIGELIRPNISERLSQAALGISALIMVSYALIKSLPRWRFCEWAFARLPKARVPFVLGFLIGINICPPFITALLRLLQIGGVAYGVVFFLGFFAGTSLYTIPILSISPFTRSPRLQQIGVLSAIIIGVWFIVIACVGL